jgi:hypothetical protein
MSNLADSLNLRPQEKRIIVVIAFVVFVVLNLVLVFPRFKEYAKIHDQLIITQKTIATNKAVIFKDTNEVNGLKGQLRDLEEQKGGAVTFKEIQLLETVSALARASGVPPPQSTSPVSSTVIGPGSQSDKFFESQSIRINVQSVEDALVKFLYDLGNDPAMIRVRELEMRPVDNNRYRLNAFITLIADYQKTAQAKPVLTAAGAAPKTAAQPPTPAPPRTGARAASTNVNPPPAGRGSAPAIGPPAPGRAATSALPPPTAGRAITPRGPVPPTPGRAVIPPMPVPPAPVLPAMPPVPGQSNLPAVPPRTPR